MRGSYWLNDDRLTPEQIQMITASTWLKKRPSKVMLKALFIAVSHEITHWEHSREDLAVTPTKHDQQAEKISKQAAQLAETIRDLNPASRLAISVNLRELIVLRNL